MLFFILLIETNKYNLICAQFVGINHQWNNILFGCAFLVNENIELFIWFFEIFLTVMVGKQPISIYTDQDQAIANRGAQKTHRLAKPDPIRRIGSVFKAWWVRLGYKKIFITSQVGFGS